MVVVYRNVYHQNFGSVRYGALLSSITLLTIVSILHFVGKLELYLSRSTSSTSTSTISTITIDGSFAKDSTVNKALGQQLRTKSNSSKTRNPPQTNAPLEVAWLMSFPNSGTTYTNHLIQDYTNTTTATNYGQEQSTKLESIPIYKDSIDGPFFRYPSWWLPPKYILTKTHCGGECDACQDPSDKQYIDTIEGFETACCTGKKITTNGTKVKTTYSSDIPRRAIHLIRDPFDNIVARLHLKERRWGRHHNDAKYDERVDVFNETKEGFLAYCRFRDISSLKQEFHNRLLSDELLQYATKVPCYSEFITYTKWHNHAIELLAKKSIPFLTLFYEDYASDWNGTVNNLLEFLSLDPAKGSTAEAFILGKHYDEFYTTDEQFSATKLLQALASDELWDILQQRYFS